MECSTGVDMIDLNDAVSLLHAKRKELSDQLDAVDKALAALSGVAVAPATRSAATPHQPDVTADTVVPSRIKPRRTLSDEHKHALIEGRRKARHSKEAAAGRARELPEPSQRLAPASGAGGLPPRLVKRTRSGD